MIVMDVRNNAVQGLNDIRGVETPTQPGFPNNQITLSFNEIKQRHHRHNFEKSRMLLGRKLIKRWFQLDDQLDDFALANMLPIDLQPLAKRDQMRRRKQPDPQPRSAVNAFEHRAGRTFAIRPGNMDEAQLVLRIAGQSSQLEGVG